MPHHVAIRKPLAFIKKAVQKKKENEENSYTRITELPNVKIIIVLGLNIALYGQQYSNFTSQPRDPAKYQDTLSGCEEKNAFFFLPSYEKPNAA